MMPNGIRIRSTVFPQCTGQTDARTDRRTNTPTDRPRESLTTVFPCATRATRPNNHCPVTSLLTLAATCLGTESATDLYNVSSHELEIVRKCLAVDEDCSSDAAEFSSTSQRIKQSTKQHHHIPPDLPHCAQWPINHEAMEAPASGPQFLGQKIGPAFRLSSHI